MNLIENAIKYAKEGTPIILDYEKEDSKIIISVKNDYDIIPREKLKKLFDLASNEYETIRVTWHGGEPMLLGKKYISEVLKYQKQDSEILLYSSNTSFLDLILFS